MYTEYARSVADLKFLSQTITEVDMEIPGVSDGQDLPMLDLSSADCQQYRSAKQV